MSIVEILLISLLIVIGILTSITDTREGRIYNKTLLIFMIMGLILDMVYYGYLARNLFLPFLLNFVVIALISLTLFYTHTFAGGDCKLSLVMALLYPAGNYLMYGTSKATLFFALCIGIFYGYIYLLVSSLFSLIKGKTKLSKTYITGYLLSFFKSFISASGYICLINLFFIYLAMQGIYINEWIIRAICMALAWFIGKNVLLKKWILVICVYLLNIGIGLFLRFLPFSFNPENYIMVIVLLIFQMTIRTILYEEINIADLKKGMILSTMSSMVMQNSRVRGLPPVSTEDLKSRLTEEQVNSICRWSKSRKIETITIVRKIPFAIFIFSGFLSYFVIWGVIK